MTPTVKSGGTHFPDTFLIQNDLKEGALSTFLLNFALEFAIRKVQAKQDVLELNGANQFLVYANDINLLGESILTTNKNTEALLESSKEIVLQVNAETTKYMSMSISRKRKVGKIAT